MGGNGLGYAILKHVMRNTKRKDSAMRMTPLEHIVIASRVRDDGSVGESPHHQHGDMCEEAFEVPGLDQKNG